MRDWELTTVERSGGRKELTRRPSWGSNCEFPREQKDQIDLFFVFFPTPAQAQAQASSVDLE